MSTSTSLVLGEALTHIARPAEIVLAAVCGRSGEVNQIDGADRVIGWE
jgi:hypothetical protein